MIEVKSVKDNNKALLAAKAAGIEFGDGCEYITATEKGEILGHSFIKIEGDTVRILSIEPHDFIMFDFILRSSLHIALERGIRAAVYDNTDAEELYIKLGFIDEISKRTLLIGKLFESCSCCESK